MRRNVTLTITPYESAGIDMVAEFQGVDADTFISKVLCRELDKWNLDELNRKIQPREAPRGD